MKRFVGIISLCLILLSLGTVSAQNVVAARFIKGEKALQTFIKNEFVVPTNASQNDWVGVVHVSFVVERDGSVSTIKIEDDGGLNSIVQQSCINVMKKTSGMWEPAMANGKPVRMRFTQPIRVNIPADHSNSKKKKRRRIKGNND